MNLKQILSNFFFKKEQDNKLNFEKLEEEANSYNGYKREKAVCSLGELGDIRAIPILLERLNDWVDEVAIVSQKSLNKLLIDKNVEAFVEYFPNIYRLGIYQRKNHKAIFEKIITFLLQEKNSIYLIKAINNQNIYTARLAFDLCLEHQLLSNEQLIEKGLKSQDVVLKKRVSFLLEKLESKVLEKFLKIAILDNYMPIRREAFEIYLQRYTKIGLELSFDFMFDKNISIREIALKSLQKNSVDLESICLNILQDKNSSSLELKSAMGGVHFLDLKESVDSVKKFMTHSSSSVRKETLETLEKLLKEESKAYLFKALEDKSAKVAKRASVLLNRFYRHTLERPKIVEIAKKKLYPHSLSIALSLLTYINKWERLLGILEIFDRSFLLKQNNKSIFIHQLKQWDKVFNKTSIKITPLQKEKIVLKYNESKALFDEDVFEYLAFTIKVL